RRRPPARPRRREPRRARLARRAGLDLGRDPPGRDWIWRRSEGIVAGSPSGRNVENVESLSGDREAPSDGQQRLPRQQQDPATFSAESAHAAVLAREREALREAARVVEGHAHHRQAWHRESRRGLAGAWREDLIARRRRYA